MSRFGRDFKAQFNALSPEELKSAKDYDRGVADAIRGEFKQGQSVAYNEGYGNEYSLQMVQQGVIHDN